VQNLHLLALPRRGGREIKEFYTSGNNLQLYHDGSNGVAVGNATPTIQPIAGIAQGTANGQRIGDDVHVKDASIRLWLSNKSDRPNVMYRVAVVLVPGTSAAVSPSVVNIFPNAGQQFITAFPDTTQYSVLYDKIVNKDVYSH
jgi:hypothetical protein